MNDPMTISTCKKSREVDKMFVFLFSPSGVLAEERQLSQDLVQSSKKDQGFRSIFQHVKTAQSHQTPSELFAHHIVAIVHHIKGEMNLCVRYHLLCLIHL